AHFDNLAEKTHLLCNLCGEDRRSNPPPRQITNIQIARVVDSEDVGLSAGSRSDRMEPEYATVPTNRRHCVSSRGDGRKCTAGDIGPANIRSGTREAATRARSRAND